MNFKDFITKFSFEVDHAPLEKVEKKLDQIKERLEFLAAAEVIKGIYELGEKFAHFAEELHVAAVSAGLTVEAFQKLSFAAAKSSISQEELGGAMARLSRRIYEARMGSEEAQKAFLQAGLSPQQVLTFKNGGDAMAALADRFQNIQDPIQKSALAMQLMGRGSVNMVAFLSQGSAAIRETGAEAEKLGIILSGQQVEALVKVEHSFHELWAVMKALGATIASYFAPSIETAIHDFLKFYEVNKKLIDTNVRAWVWDITFALGFVYEAVKTVAQEFFNFAKSHEVLVRRVIEVVAALVIFVGMLWTVQKTLGILKGGFGLVQSAIEPFAFLWQKAFWPAVMWIGNIVKMLAGQLLLKLATLTETALPLLSEAFLGLGAAIEATPVGWLITAIAALVIVLHDAYVLLFGSGKWEDTWIGKAINAAKGFGKSALKFFGFGGDEEGDKKTYSAEDIMKTVPGAGKVQSVFEGLNQAQQVASPTISAFGGGAGGGAAGITQNEFNIDAPVTITVPAGTDHKMVGDKVKEGITEHLDKIYRRTTQSLRPAQAY